MTSARFLTTSQATLLAATAQRFGQRPSSLLGLTEPRVALDLDQALHIVLAKAERAAVQASTGGPFGRLDAILAGQTPRYDEHGLAYEDVKQTYSEVMRARRAEGLVN